MGQPEPVYGHEARRRSPSPLRNSFNAGDLSADGSEVDEDDPHSTWGGKRPVSLELVDFVSGMSASTSGPAGKQAARRGEKMVRI